MSFTRIVVGKKQIGCPATVTKKLRAEVFWRDQYTCQTPGCKYVNHNGDGLVIHHRDHDRKNNFRSNLVTMCGPCNTVESNHHRGAVNKLKKLYAAAHHHGVHQKYFPMGPYVG